MKLAMTPLSVAGVGGRAGTLTPVVVYQPTNPLFEIEIIFFFS